MKNVLIAAIIILPTVSFAKTCQGTYSSPYRTLEVDGKGYCSMEANGAVFEGPCRQQKDGSVTVVLGGNSFYGQWAPDCSQIVIDGQTYVKKH